MKKLLCIALLSIAIMGSTVREKDITTSTIAKKEIVKNNSMEVLENHSTALDTEDFFGCGALGNAMYDDWRAEGYTHREARALRRAAVRECRGNGPDGWLSIFISWA